MAIQPSADEAVTKLMCDESTSVVSSAKMHIRILQAQLLYLRETGSVTMEIEDMMSSLMATFPHSPGVVAQSQTNPPTPITEILHPPLMVSIKTEYISKNYRHVVANPGDEVVVFAWTNNRTEATAYNSRNKTVGRIPADILDKEGSKPATDTEICMATSDQKHVSLGHVKWKGDYIRVWNKESRKHAMIHGIGFNLATGEIGEFVTSSFSLRVID